MADRPLTNPLITEILTALTSSPDSAASPESRMAKIYRLDDLAKTLSYEDTSAILHEALRRAQDPSDMLRFICNLERTEGTAGTTLFELLQNFINDASVPKERIDEVLRYDYLSCKLTNDQAHILIGIYLDKYKEFCPGIAHLAKRLDRPVEDFLILVDATLNCAKENLGYLLNNTRIELTDEQAFHILELCIVHNKITYLDMDSYVKKLSPTQASHLLNMTFPADSEELQKKLMVKAVAVDEAAVTLSTNAQTASSSTGAGAGAGTGGAGTGAGVVHHTAATHGRQQERNPRHAAPLAGRRRYSAPLNGHAASFANTRSSSAPPAGRAT
jgi:hypothetical protein